MIGPQHFEDLHHRFARAVVPELAIAFHDVKKLTESLFEFFISSQRLSKIEANLYAVRLGGQLLPQCRFIGTLIALQLQARNQTIGGLSFFGGWRDSFQSL